MRLNHLGLPVRDGRRSQEFYSAYFGFDPATAQEYEDGTVIIRNAEGFDLALHPTEHIEPSPAFLHAGFRVAAPDEVRALLARMEADGVTIVEHDEEPAYVAFKCLDPDGHKIEVYWEPPPTPVTCATGLDGSGSDSAQTQARGGRGAGAGSDPGSGRARGGPGLGRTQRGGTGNASVAVVPPVTIHTAWLPQPCRQGCMNQATMQYE